MRCHTQGLQFWLLRQLCVTCPPGLDLFQTDSDRVTPTVSDCSNPPVPGHKLHRAQERGSLLLHQMQRGRLPLPSAPPDTGLCRKDTSPRSLSRWEGSFWNASSLREVGSYPDAVSQSEPVVVPSEDVGSALCEMEPRVRDDCKPLFLPLQAAIPCRYPRCL